ncbi:MAG: class I SAM-dependent methyltransferase [Desulfobulbaceae bacterium]|nr:class I SAM-dependent methyltransferase [Desulfobulbaceae bacterium]HIJ90808.1 class I SAM-dependent methyltransferase [Deltaproteobacteria bacterium]
MNQWNQLVDIFCCKCHEDTIPECAADNICIAWPSIIKCINVFLENQTRLKALDFGCGGGLFCKKLHEMGFEVTGYDESEELIKAAHGNTPQEVVITNSSTLATTRGKYDLITSIMVFQFIADIDATIKKIVSLLKPNGLLVYAVFNPTFIEENSNNHVFTGFTNNRSGYMELQKGIKIPVYNRSESEYRHIFDKFDYEEAYLDLPEFTEEFLEKYQMPFSTTHSEYLIQAFRKKTSNLIS